MELNLKEIEELHKNRKWISWEEEGYLISCVEKLEASNKKLRETIEESYDLLQQNLEYNRGQVSSILKKALEE